MAARTLGPVVRQLREARQLTQVELAAQAHLSQGYLAALEGGRKANPSLETLKKLAKALHVPVTELLE